MFYKGLSWSRFVIPLLNTLYNGSSCIRGNWQALRDLPVGIQFLRDRTGARAPCPQTPAVSQLSPMVGPAFKWLSLACIFMNILIFKKTPAKPLNFSLYFNLFAQATAGLGARTLERKCEVEFKGIYVWTRAHLLGTYTECAHTLFYFPADAF